MLVCGVCLCIGVCVYHMWWNNRAVLPMFSKRGKFKKFS